MEDIVYKGKKFTKINVNIRIRLHGMKVEFRDSSYRAKFRQNVLMSLPNENKR